MENDFLVQLITRLDTSKTATDINKLQQELEKKNIKLKTVLDTSTSKQELQNFAVQLQKVLQSQGINIDTSKILSSLNQVTLEAQKVANQVNKIQLSIDTGAYDAKVADLIAKTNQWTDANGNARISTTNLSKALDNLTTAERNLASSDTVANRQALIDAEAKLDIEVKKTTNAIKEQNAVYAKDSAISSLHNKIQDFYDKNSATHLKWGNQLMQMLAQTASGANLTKEQVAQISDAFNQVVSSARQAGKLGKSFFDTIKSGMKSFSYWTSSTFIVMKTIQSIKSAISTVKELDTALVDLKKTTTMTAKELEDFYYASNETAKKMGVSTKAIIEQASAWSRLGLTK